MKSLTENDLLGIKKVIDAAVSKDVTTGLNRLPEAKGLSAEALALLGSLTTEELAAFHSVFVKLKSSGAKQKDLTKWIL